MAEIYHGILLNQQGDPAPNGAIENAALKALIDRSENAQPLNATLTSLSNSTIIQVSGLNILLGSSTNVGIGKGSNAPQYRLDIFDSNTQTPSGASVNIEHATAPRLRFRTSTSGYRYYLGMNDTTHNLELIPDSLTPSIFINQGGSIGIGTSRAAPQDKLDVDGGIRAGSTLYPAKIANVPAPYYGSGLYLTADEGQYVRSMRLVARNNGSGSSIDMVIEASTAHQAYYGDPGALSYSELIRIKQSGAIGVGATPLAKVHVVTTSEDIMYLDAYGSSGINNMIFRKARGSISSPSAVQSGDELAWIGARGYGATNFSTASRAAIVMTTAENWTDSAQGTRIVFCTTSNGSASKSDRMVISDAGYLGIGATAPAQKLHLHTGSATPVNLTISNSYTGSTSGAIVGIDAYGALCLRSFGDGYANTYLGGTAAAPMLTCVGNGIAAAEVSIAAKLSTTGDIYTTAFTDYSNSSTIVGFSSFTRKQIFYKKIGKLVTVWFNLYGTADGVLVSFTLPYGLNTNLDLVYFNTVTDDNATRNAGLGYIAYSDLAPDSAHTIILNHKIGLPLWSNGSTAGVYGQFTYEAAS